MKILYFLFYYAEMDMEVPKEEEVEVVSFEQREANEKKELLEELKVVTQ